MLRLPMSAVSNGLQHSTDPHPEAAAWRGSSAASSRPHTALQTNASLHRCVCVWFVFFVQARPVPGSCWLGRGFMVVCRSCHSDRRLHRQHQRALPPRILVAGRRGIGRICCRCPEPSEDDPQHLHPDPRWVRSFPSHVCRPPSCPRDVHSIPFELTGH